MKIILNEDETQRGPAQNSRKVYKKGAPQLFMDEIRATGKCAMSVDEVTGQGVMVGLFNPRSAKTESGRDIALVLFEIFRADESLCCHAATKLNKKTGVHTCRECEKECRTEFSWIRKPTYVPNPRSGGRMALWNQCIVQWPLIPGVIDGMKVLSGGAVEQKKVEIQATKDVVSDKEMAALRPYGI